MITPVKIEYDEAPNRCLWVNNGQQCAYQQIPNSKYCPIHDMGRTEKAEKKESLRSYQLGVWQNRVGQFADDSKIKSLREEIGITRMGLEMLIGKLQTDTDIILNLPKITHLIGNIEKLVLSANKLESSLGMMLDKQQVVQLAMEISQIIGTYVKDEEILSKISEAISDAIERIGKVVFE